MRVGFRLVALALPTLMSCTANAADPYAPKSMPYLAVSADGRYVGATTTRGDLKVWDLTSREMIFEPGRGYLEGIAFGQGIAFVDFIASEKKAIWNCAAGRVCWKKLNGDGHGTLFDHDPQDDILQGLVSEDGSRMAFGTVRGRIFTYDPASQEQRELKPRDVWSRGHAWQIYALEGVGDIELFLTASANVTPSSEGVDFGDDWWVFKNPDRGDAKYIKYNGIVVWDYETGEAHEIYDDFSDKVQADVSADVKKLVLHQRSSRARGIYSLPKVELVDDLDGVARWPSDGVRFLDRAGRYLGVVNDSARVISVIDLESRTESKAGLKGKPATGRRVLAAYPKNGWVFIGLAKGGVDWYQFRAGSKPALKHITTLR